MSNKLKSEIDKEILELEKERFSLKMLLRSKELKQTHKISLIKKNIARLKTKSRNYD